MSIVPGIQLHTQNFDPFYRQILLGGAPGTLDPINNFNSRLVTVADFTRYQNIGLALHQYLDDYVHQIQRPKGAPTTPAGRIFSLNIPGFNQFCSNLMNPSGAAIVWADYGRSTNVEIRKIIDPVDPTISIGKTLRTTAEHCDAGYCDTPTQCFYVIGPPIIQTNNASPVSVTRDGILQLVAEIKDLIKRKVALDSSIPSYKVTFTALTTQDNSYGPAPNPNTVTKCSICGIINRRGKNQKLINCKFSCEHTLEALLLLMTLGLSPFEYATGNALHATYLNAIDFLNEIRCYTYCCERCNQLKAKCQRTSKKDNPGCTIFVKFNGAQFENNTFVYEQFCDKFFNNDFYYHCDDYTKYYIISMLIWFGPDDDISVKEYIEYYFGSKKGGLKDIVLSKAKDATRRGESAYEYITKRIEENVTPLVTALNTTLFGIWGGRFSDMMIFGLLKMIVIQILDIQVTTDGRLVHMTPGTGNVDVPQIGVGGTKNISKINNSLLKYNLKGGVKTIAELADLINYGTLNCIDRPLSFKGSVYTVIATQRFKQLLRRKGIEITPEAEAEAKNVAIQVIDYTNTHPVSAHQTIDHLELNPTDKEIVNSIVDEATEEAVQEAEAKDTAAVAEQYAASPEGQAERLIMLSEERERMLDVERQAKREKEINQAEKKRQEEKKKGFDLRKLNNPRPKLRTGSTENFKLGGTLRKRKTRKNKKTKRRKQKKHLKRKTRKA
jgi:hypothetical protein